MGFHFIFSLSVFVVILYFDLYFYRIFVFIRPLLRIVYFFFLWAFTVLRFYFIAHSYFFGYGWENKIKKNCTRERRIENGFYCNKNEFLVSIKYIPRKENIVLFAKREFLSVQLLFFTWFTYSSMEKHSGEIFSSTFNFIWSDVFRSFFSPLFDYKVQCCLCWNDYVMLFVAIAYLRNTTVHVQISNAIWHPKN